MAKYRNIKDFMYEDDGMYMKSTKSKSNQYNKCRNDDCEENDNGFCSKYKNKAKNVCKKFR